MANASTVRAGKWNVNEDDVQAYIKKIQRALNNTPEKETVTFDFGKITHISNKGLHLLAILQIENQYRVRFTGMTKSIDQRMQRAKGHVIMVTLMGIEEMVLAD